MKGPETLIKQKIRAYLRDERHAYVFCPVQMGYGAATLDDLVCLPVIITPAMVGMRVGLFVAIESKVPGKKPTPRQNFTIKAINDAGGVAFWTDSLDYTKEMLRSAGL